MSFRRDGAFACAYALVLVFVVASFYRHMRSIRYAASGKRLAKRLVDVLADVIDPLDSETMVVLRKACVEDRVHFMLLRRNGDVIFGADWNGDVANVKAMRTYGTRESTFGELLDKAATGGGYVTYHVRRAHDNARCKVTAYGKTVRRTDYVLCATTRYD